MRIRFLLFSALAILGTCSWSSPVTEAQLVRGWGFKGGVAVSDIDSPPLSEVSVNWDEYTRRLQSGAAVAYVEWLNVPFFSVVTEAGYAPRGYYNEYERTNQEGEVVESVQEAWRFHYLTTEVLAKGRLPLQHWAPYAIAGPSLMILLGRPDDNLLGETYSTAAFGGTVGMGLEVPAISFVTPFIEMRYSFDVTNSLPDVPRDAYNSAAEFLLGVRF